MADEQAFAEETRRMHQNELSELKQCITELRAENAWLKAVNAQLREENRRLEATKSAKYQKMGIRDTLWDGIEED